MTARRNVPYYLAGPSHNCSRRSFLVASGSLAAAAMWAPRALGAVQGTVPVSDYPFQLGVASGEPSPTGVVLWTRLAPQPLEGGGMPAEPVAVDWEIAEDEKFSKVVDRGTVTATPEWAHSVHIEVEGLRPARWYYYRFGSCGEMSPVGRTRTLPAAGVSDAPLRFAFASCQNYEQGYFTAYERMAEEDLDLMVHLGDYIYEKGGSFGLTRRHIGGTAKTLEDYRNRYGQYKADSALQGMHAAAPWIVTWDDHEVSNNYADSISEKEGTNPEKFLERRAAAYKAYYEHMPLRLSSLPHGPHMPLYRRIGFGKLATFHVLDTRQYRTDQPYGDGRHAPGPESHNEEATILGAAQRKWLAAGLASSPARWNILAQQVLMAPIDYFPGDGELVDMDQWPGYEADRRRVLKMFADERVKNPVVLTGDNHRNWANELLADANDKESRPVAVELVGTSISSGGDGGKLPKRYDEIVGENSYIKFFNGERGYVRCTVTPQEWRTDFRVVPYVTRQGAPIETRASFVIESGKPRLNEA